MKGLRLINDELSCLNENAIIYENNFYSKITGNLINGFSVEKPQLIEEIGQNGWSELYSSLEVKNEKYNVIAGETSWGGTGFVAIQNLKSNSFKWVLHLSTMNNPTEIKIGKNLISVTTDANYPVGVDFVIPIHKPENFKIQKPATNKMVNL
jgi:hypothetical protein